MNAIILHIPHSGSKIPFFFWKRTVLSRKDVIEFKNIITDTNMDKLFGQGNEYKKIIFKYSRIFCDVERFADDSKEIMSKFGMGVIYTRTINGDEFLKPTPVYKSFVLKRFYRKYHKRLEKVAKKYLNANEKVVFIDCHSFSEKIIIFNDAERDLPDICIGYNDVHNDKLIKFVYTFLKNKNYTVKLNTPYKGSMTPERLKANENFCSFMIEVNKKVYMNEEGFGRLNGVLNDLFRQIEKLNI